MLPEAVIWFREFSRTVQHTICLRSVLQFESAAVTMHQPSSPSTQRVVIEAVYSECLPLAGMYASELH